MPQMMPMLWMFMMFIIVMLMMMIILVIYYYYYCLYLIKMFNYFQKKNLKLQF